MNSPKLPDSASASPWARLFKLSAVVEPHEQALRRVTQYAIARPSREICFTVVEQENRYKTKNIIDVVVYRLGDLSSAWMQAGMRWLGFGMAGALGMGVVASALWALSAWTLGRQYERRRAMHEGTASGAALRQPTSTGGLAG